MHELFAKRMPITISKNLSCSCFTLLVDRSYKDTGILHVARLLSQFVMQRHRWLIHQAALQLR